MKTAQSKISVISMGTDRAIEISEKNRQLGREKRRMRDGLPEEERAASSILVQKKLRLLTVYHRAKSVLIYVSFGSELSTISMIEMAFTDGKEVFCPRVEGKRMNFYRISSLEELAPGCKRILEPDGSSEIYRAGQNSIAIVPGSAFDPYGHRIGYGGGYYDRWLAHFAAGEKPYCAGVCFSCQMTEEIQPLSHDVAMDVVLHE